jgi:hypothetical protein
MHGQFRLGGMRYLTSRSGGRSLAALSVVITLTAVASPPWMPRSGPGPVTGPGLQAGIGQHGGLGQRAAGPAPDAAGHPPYAQLTGVSCTDARSCVAVGFHTIGRGPALHPLAEAWNGRSWRRLPAPVIHGRLLGISCPRPRRCIAVGSHDDAAGSPASPLAATWNGRTWRLWRTAPLRGSPGVTDLASVSCTGPRHCVAVSGYGDAEPVVTTAAETWNGRGWRLRAVFGQSSLNGVACRTAVACLAVGSTSPASDSWAPFAARAMAGTWRAVATPPGDTGNLGTSLSGVSCAATTMCMAVGEGMLIDQWTGSAWTQLASPGPGSLNGISCKVAASCVAVGQDGQQAAAARAWDGSSWRALAPVRPTGPSLLASVSCSAPARCMAVGYHGTPFVRRTLAERWNGTTWQRLTAPAG